MSNKVVTVEMDDNLETVKKIFDNVSFNHLLVVNSEELVGVISQIDLYKSLSPNLDTTAEKVSDRVGLNKKAHQIMTRKPITLNVSAKAHDIIDAFNRNKISCIPVIDNNNKPVGIISWRDILKIIQTGS